MAGLGESHQVYIVSARSARVAEFEVLSRTGTFTHLTFEMDPIGLLSATISGAAMKPQFHHVRIILCIPGLPCEHSYL